MVDPSCSPWVESGAVHNEEYRHTSLIATLRKAWGLGDPFTQRDASAPTFEHGFSRDDPRDPSDWTNVTARPVPKWTMDDALVGQALSTMGKGLAPALFAKAQEMGVELPADVIESGGELPPERIVGDLRQVAAHLFPLLAESPGGSGG